MNCIFEPRSRTACKNLGRVRRGRELVRVDPGALAVRRNSTVPLAGEVLLHVPVHVRAEIGISADRIRSGDQPGDAVLAQGDRGQRLGRGRL